MLIFVRLILVAAIDYENIFTMKISRFTVYSSDKLVAWTLFAHLTIYFVITLINIHLNRVISHHIPCLPVFKRVMVTVGGVDIIELDLLSLLSSGAVWRCE